MKSKILCAILLSGTALNAIAQTNDSGESKTPCCYKNSCCNGNNQSPVGIMTDHIHPKGEWMFSYTNMLMGMSGMASGANGVSKSEVYNSYMMAPGTMTMQMHMLMAMYGVTDRFTMMVMGAYQSAGMKMTMKPMVMQGMEMPEQTMYMDAGGLSDTRVSALYNISQKDSRRIIASLTAIVPTGRCDAQGINMLGAQQWMPYSMQPGTGSWGITPGLTWAHPGEKWGYGADALGELRLNDNSMGYRVGNYYRASAWGSYRCTNFLNASLRAEYANQQSTSGVSNYSSLRYVVGDDPSYIVANTGRSMLSAYVGANIHFQKNFLSHFDLLIEGGIPFFEHVNGLQMSNQFSFTTTLQYSL